MPRRKLAPNLPPSIYAGGIVDDEAIHYVKLVSIPNPKRPPLLAIIHEQDEEIDGVHYQAGEWRIRVNDADVPCKVFYCKTEDDPGKEQEPMYNFRTVGVPIPK